MDFNKDKKLIGNGMTANLYLYEGFVYKCFKENYSLSGILEYEYKIEEEISLNTSILKHKYFKSEIPNSLKMDYIDGVTLADKIRKDKDINGVELLADLFYDVHKYHSLALPKLKNELKKSLNKIDIPERVLGLSLLEEIPDGDTLCHLDLHFLNVLASNDKLYLIDWVNAKIGNSIYDFARTYVLAYLYAYRLRNKLYSYCVKKYSLDELLFDKAIIVMALDRFRECKDSKLLDLISNVKSKLK